MNIENLETDVIKLDSNTGLHSQATFSRSKLYRKRNTAIFQKIEWLHW